MTSKRPRGFADWNPQQKTRDRLEQVNEVLETYKDQLPVTARQVYYRLVSVFGFEKTEKSYKKLLENLNRARRAGLIPMDSIRDDGATAVGLDRYSSADDFLKTCRYSAKNFQFDLQQEQPYYIEVLCEAAGMVPQLNRVARPYGIPVRSSGGFDSTTIKHRLGEFYGGKDPKMVVVLHVGDLDPSGEHIHKNLKEDVGAFAVHYGGWMTVERIAVTAAQKDEYNLPTGVPKKDDDREFPYDFTVQAEALPPDVLASIVKGAIERHTDMDIWEKAVERQAEIRLQLADLLDRTHLL